MMPPDILHLIAEGLSKYIFESLQKLIGNTKAGERAKASVERVFLKIHKAISRNNERDLPRGSSNSGMLKSTRIWGWQRHGNVLRLLCVLHTDEARRVLEPLLNKNGARVEKMAEFLKLYLSMEAWLLRINKKSEVHSSRAFIGHVIQLLQDLFPRGGQGWNIPKMHGHTQIQTFITEFGSADNFNTDTSKSNHRWLVKDTVTIT